MIVEVYKSFFVNHIPATLTGFCPTHVTLGPYSLISSSTFEFCLGLELHRKYFNCRNVYCIWCNDIGTVYIYCKLHSTRLANVIWQNYNISMTVWIVMFLPFRFYDLRYWERADLIKIGIIYKCKCPQIDISRFYNLWLWFVCL